MTRLPPELLLKIIRAASRDVQLVLRAVSKQMYGLATPLAFRVVSCGSTPRSALNLVELLDCDRLKRFIKEVVYVDKKGARRWPEDYPVDGEHKSTEETAGLPEDWANILDHDEHEDLYVNLTAALCRLPSLPNLDSISITFPLDFETFDLDEENGTLLPSYEAWAARVPELRLQLGVLSRLEVFAAARAMSQHLARKPKAKHTAPAATLRALTLRNLNAHFSHQLSYPGFHALFNGLTTLRLSLNSTLSATGDVEEVGMETFWKGTILPFLHIPRETLTTLALHSDQDVGGEYPGASFAGLHYPRLQQLSLCHLLLDEVTAVEDFILAHARTLRSLVLIDCKIVVASDSASADPPPRTWAQVYETLGRELMGLTELKVIEAPSPGLHPSRPIARYTSWHEEYLWMQYTSPPRGWDAADDAALETLKEIVEERTRRTSMPS
ncbi:hypothetical protein FA95DRAFT_1679145 [Auriscalpium vulgare]|uniref:Uncharacterized protein n=1 Tax=Auriscalpium vulgare TaxID=40419 RepID=A0ACB8RTP9_9AGAM|nr:hypothetical protein FA95DRAFT_1679145 [Auriscalpium vulgare]